MLTTCLNQTRILYHGNPYWPYLVMVIVNYSFSSISTSSISLFELQIIINFDWGSWEEGRKMAYDENFNFDTIDIPTKCKLITAVVRNDRFCEGALVESFESGLILKLLKSIEKQLG